MVSPLQAVSDGAYRLRTVVIDPGHGGRDPGALGRRSREKDIVLAVSLKLGEYINQHLPDVNVIYTRSTDEFVELHRRAEIANRNNADLFISIHANANTNRTVRGTDTFVMGHHTSKENLEVAMKENAAILLEDDYDEQYEGFDPNSSESYIIFSLMQNTYLSQSLDFASYVQGQFRERVGRVDRGVRQAGFLVLWQTTMPSVLIEVGFISNEEEERFLMSEQGQAYIASAIFRAFRDYKVSIERKSDALYAAGGGNINRNGRRDSRVAGAASGNSGTVAENSADIASVDSEQEAKEMERQETVPKTGEGDEVVFKVQVGSSRNKIPLDSDFFGGIEDVEVFESGGLFRYVVGASATLEDAAELRTKLQQIFPDAFIVAVSEGRLVSLQEVLNRD
ncbi:MAG: N-acetylmuramoyl-L-alanine amidase [Marinilabiliales bacterium]|nr:MAG: N-acetylmuramoyl-L-alanine amidase [Marinilabiliales bacterium]